MAAAFILPAGMALAQTDGGPQFRSDDIVRSTVRVVVENKLGRKSYSAGWIIAPKDDVNRAGNAIIVTTRHTLPKRLADVRQGAGGVTVVTSDGVELPARIRTVRRETDQDYDLAFLEVKGIEAPALRVSEAAPDSGRPVYALGYSVVSDQSEGDSGAKKAAVKSGTLSKSFSGGMTRASQAPVDQIEHNVPLEAGYSGGPLIDFCGRVIGVNTTDGGYLKLGVASAPSVGSNFALAPNELISVASQEGVPVERVPGGSCGPTAAAGPPLQLQLPAPKAKVSAIQNIGDYFRSHPLYLGAVIVVALAALGLGIWLLVTGQRTPLLTSGPGVSGPGAGGEAPPPPVAPDASPVIELSGRGPDGEPLNFRFTADELTAAPIKIGADPDVTVRIDRRTDYKVSRNHASLGYDGRNFTVEDLKSVNKTKIGGTELAPHKPRVLMQGDELELADVKLRVNIR